MVKRIIFIGLGGIGSIVSEKICRFVNFLHNDTYHVVLVDGDEYEPKNYERQEFSNLGSKAEVKAEELRNKFENIHFVAINEFVNKNNVHNIIDDDSIVILSLDNHKSRKIISEYVSTLNDCVLFSGGNDFIDGNVQIFIRKEGKSITPSLVDYHPEIGNPDDKSPEEMSCEELHAVEPQLFFVNLGAATLICWAFYLYLENKLDGVAEIYFDVSKLAVNAVKRAVPETN